MPPSFAARLQPTKLPRRSRRNGGELNGFYLPIPGKIENGPESGADSKRLKKWLKEIRPLAGNNLENTSDFSDVELHVRPRC